MEYVVVKEPLAGQVIRLAPNSDADIERAVVTGIGWVGEGMEVGILSGMDSPGLAEILSTLPRFYLIARKSVGPAQLGHEYDAAAVSAVDWLTGIVRCPSDADWQVVTTVAQMMARAYDDLLIIGDYAPIPNESAETGLLKLVADHFDHYLCESGRQLARQRDQVRSALNEAIWLGQKRRRAAPSAIPSIIPATPMMT